MRRILSVFALVLGAATAASAATVPYRTDAQLVAIADRVVRARVLDSVVERAPSGTIRTRTRLAVLEDFTAGTETTVTVYELGGRLADGRELWLPGVPRFTRGEEVVLCLERAAEGYRTVSLGFSAFHVADSAAGPSLTRFGGVGIVGGAAAPPAARDARALDEFRRVVATVKGVSPRLVQTEAQASAAVAAAGPVTEPYTLLGDGIRWREADTGGTINWYRNTLTPSPVQNGDTDTEIRTALRAWTEPADASITLAFGGTRQAPMGTSGDPYCTADNLGAGLITFGDPLNELPPGVLAIGGGCSDGTTHVVNGTTFDGFSHGLVVLNDTLTGFTTPPNVTRIIQHEIGHAIGLGHSEMGSANIMHPSCCSALTPEPPALGPDDYDGLRFIYPVPNVPACTYTINMREMTIYAHGGNGSTTVTTSFPECQWRAVSTVPWLTPLGADVRTGSGLANFVIAPNLGSATARTASVTFETPGGVAIQPPLAIVVTERADTDDDADGLFYGWHVLFLSGKVSGAEAGPTGDPDGDGITNLAEQAAGTHPLGRFRRYLAEGVSNAFFDTEIALFNPGGDYATALLRLQPEGGGERNWVVTLPPRGRRTVGPRILESLVTAPFATLIESDQPVVVDRTVRWGATGYGTHAEAAVEAPATAWFLAEGSTSADFQLFYLLQNPNATSVTGTVRFLRPAPAPPVDHTFTIAPRARLTIPVDTLRPEVASTDVSAVVTASQPIIAERAMYLSRPGEPFSAGHGSAGVTAPAAEWFLAEGATGSFFDLFLLIANPSTQAASVRVDYLLPSGTVLTKTYPVAAESRFTIWVDDEQLPAGSGQRPLASTAVAMRVTSTNAVPIIVERSMWWPQPQWYEAHNAPGTTVTGTRWALAGGETGGAAATETYILIANTSATPGIARVTLRSDDGDFPDPVTQDITLPPNSRTNVPLSTTFPSFVGKRFGTLIESIGATPAQIVVERAMYQSPGGVTWAAGTDLVATRLTP